MIVLKTDSTPRRSLTRRSFRGLLSPLLLCLLAPLAFGVAGCANIPFLSPAVPVADSPEQAFKDGTALEQAAQKDEDANRKDDADVKWDAADKYYRAVSAKFSGDNKVRALLDEAHVLEKKIDAKSDGSPNYTAAQQVLRTATKEPTVDPALHAQVMQEYDTLIGRMDAENAKSIQYKAMDWLVKLLGGNTEVSPILALIVIAILVTLLTWPFRVKGARSAKEMARYQPELKKLSDKYKSEPQVLMQKQQEFYKKHGISQLAGCLPALLQWPIVFLMYQLILHYQFHFRHTTFLWINPATADAAAHIMPPGFPAIIGHNLGEQDLILLALYAVSMHVQSRLTPITSTDPQQIEQQRMMANFMPIMFFVMMLNYQLPSAFVLYWVSSNVLFVGQQWWINRHLPALPPLVIESEDDSDDGASKPLKANPKLVSPSNKRRK